MVGRRVAHDIARHGQKILVPCTAHGPQVGVLDNLLLLAIHHGGALTSESGGKIGPTAIAGRRCSLCPLDILTEDARRDTQVVATGQGRMPLHTLQFCMQYLDQVCLLKRLEYDQRPPSL